jgi:hypothetical protein
VPRNPRDRQRARPFRTGTTSRRLREEWSARSNSIDLSGNLSLTTLRPLATFDTNDRRSQCDQKPGRSAPWLRELTDHRQVLPIASMSSPRRGKSRLIAPNCPALSRVSSSHSKRSSKELMGSQIAGLPSSQSRSKAACCFDESSVASTVARITQRAPRAKEVVQTRQRDHCITVTFNAAPRGEVMAPSLTTLVRHSSSSRTPSLCLDQSASSSRLPIRLSMVCVTDKVVSVGLHGRGPLTPRVGGRPRHHH